MEKLALAGNEEIILQASLGLDHGPEQQLPGDNDLLIRASALGYGGVKSDMKSQPKNIPRIDYAGPKGQLGKSTEVSMILYQGNIGQVLGVMQS